MLNILGMIILIIILIIFLILLTGIKILITYSKKDDEFKGCIKINILKKITIHTQNFPSNNKDDDERKDSEKRDVKKIMKLLKPCLNDFINYLKCILKSSKIKQIQNHLIIGMDSFADTGKYIGIIWAILSIINSLDENIKISAEPSFTGSKFDAYGDNSLEIYPLKLLIPTIKLFLKKDVRKFTGAILNDK